MCVYVRYFICVWVSVYVCVGGLVSQPCGVIISPVQEMTETDLPLPKLATEEADVRALN